MADDSGPGRSGQPHGSIDLGLGPGHGLGQDRRGNWLVPTGTELASFTPDGARRWRVDTPDATGGFVTAPDGAILRVEGDRIVTRDPDSGEVAGTAPAHGAQEITLDPWGGLLYLARDPAGAGGLRCTSVTGADRWSVPLAGPEPASAPVAVGDSALVQHGGSLCAFDREGRVRWSAGHDGFREPDAAGPAPVEADRLWLAPRAVGGQAFLVGWEWQTSHRRLFLVDWAARTVTPYADGIVPKPPVAVLPAAGAGFRTAVQGPRREVRRMEWQWSVVMLDDAGEPAWEHWLPTEPAGVLPGEGGTLIVAGTPTSRRWEAYGRWQDLSRDTYVRCLGPGGDGRWTWYAPGPQTHLPRRGRDGLVYVGSQGRLWALPAQ